MTRVLQTMATHSAPTSHPLVQICAIPENSFIIKEWENARTARDYTMHFVVLSYEQGRGIIP